MSLLFPVYVPLKGFGFKLAYEKFKEGVWFPVHYGAEFEIRALFLYMRKIGIALNNNGFKRAHVATRVLYDPSKRGGLAPEPAAAFIATPSNILGRLTARELQRI